MNAVEQIKAQAEALSPSERADLAFFLLTSLEPPDQKSNEEWEADLARRVREIRSGAVEGLDFDEVMADLEKQYP